MTLFISMLSVILLLTTAAAGAWRGVRISLTALIGTLLAMALIDLWHTPLDQWVRATLRPEDPGRALWFVETGLFVAAAGLIGYGTALLLPHLYPAAPPQPRERAIGGLLGLLNGALVSGYLVRQATMLLREADALTLRDAAFPRFLADFTPWFVLLIVVLAGAAVLVRVALQAPQWLAARQAAQPVATPTPRTTQAQAQGQAAAYQRLNDKIDQALGKK